MAPDTAPLVAIAPARPRLDTIVTLAGPSSILATAVPDAGLAPALVGSTTDPRRDRITAIQLRI